MTTWIATTQDNKLADRTSDIESTNATTAADLQLDGNEYQALRGFGGCFNELGWLPLQNVSEAERDQIIKELFSPDEMNFTFNRAPSAPMTSPTTGTATTRSTATTGWSISPSNTTSRP